MDRHNWTGIGSENLLLWVIRSRPDLIFSKVDRSNFLRADPIQSLRSRSDPKKISVDRSDSDPIQQIFRMCRLDCHLRMWLRKKLKISNFIACIMLITLCYQQRVAYEFKSQMFNENNL